MKGGAGVFAILAAIQSFYLASSLLTGTIVLRGLASVERDREPARYRLFVAGCGVSAAALWIAAVCPWMRDPL